MEIVVAVIVAALIIGMAIYFVGQQLILRLTNLNNEQRKGSREEIESGVKGLLDSNQKLLDATVKNLQRELKTSREQIGSLKDQNAAIREQLANTAKITEGLQASTEGLRKVLSNNQLRGKWGEQVAEDLLLAAGFVEKVNYTKQTASGEGRPDFTINLPDGSRLNIDAKFPFTNLIAYQEAKTDASKKEAITAFKTDVQTKINQIASKDYIDPQKNTLDFAVMFIPNEMIFSFIYEKLPELNEYSNQRKVVLTGPFGFTAVLRLVLQAYRNFGYEKGLQEILGLITKFQSEYEKFGGSMERLGKQIETAQKTYLEVEGTRSRQLTKVVDQISNKSQLDLEEPSKKRLD
ncbi:MAG TPA: DNA recombination protein RmuC [Candidatus Saccharimonadales bacterium]|nr:DNA recombination protein RmuC [Candidatus Saccharimonadales bacterium]